VVTQVAQSVDQVRSVSQDLASNAQEQSASVEEVTANLQETDSQVKSSAENARVTDQLVNQTTTLASQGQEKMKAMTDSMAAINHSSQEIAKIIKVIDDIAFQTNLLALNAAVEAARAGQHGRGFAVVAQEVRNLAERSAKAAKSTSELIEDSTRRVQEGVKITDDTAGSLKEIVQNVVKVKDLVGEIAAASDEQTKALGQINKAMNQVNQGTQSNSTQSEELASTADELGGLAGRLREEVARFQLRRMESLGRLGAMGSDVVGQNADVSHLPVAGVAATAGRAGQRVGLKGNGGKSSAEEGGIDRDSRGYGKF
jgi:methyl-accepting chemotaxis protein